MAQQKIITKTGKDQISAHAASVLERVGNTPLVPLRRLGADLAPHVELYAKLEWFNPSGSVKDRPAAEILRQALASGQLDQGRTLLDSSSGNMGIAYATFCAALGIPVHITLPANASRMRIRMLEALGATLTLTDPLEGTDGARDEAAKMAAENPARYFYADQYSNPANWQAHYKTTGPELLRQTQGRITHLVAGLGTSGTLMGVSRFFASQSIPLRRIAVQPDGPLHGLEGLKHMESSQKPSIFDPLHVDQIVHVSTEEAYAMARRLARHEGLLVGVSAAAAALAALQVAADLEKGVLAVIFPDSGLKYLDLPFWS
jgi:cysteine synthase B